MALDWEPLPAPKRASEREYEDLFAKLAVASGRKREQLLGWFANVAVPVFETIGAPRVGRDEAADTWLFERAQRSGRLHELPALRVEYHDYPVLELLPPCDGFPVYSNHRNSEHLERYSFNAELLADVADELGDALCESAHTWLLPLEHEEYAMALHEVAAKFVADHALDESVATIREPVFPEGSIERRGHVLFAAAKWCTYWSLRGHGLCVTF